MSAEHHLKLLWQKGRQIVCIPPEFEFPTQDAVIRKEGRRLIIEAAPRKSLLAILSKLPTLDEDFPPVADSAPEPVAL